MGWPIPLTNTQGMTEVSEQCSNLFCDLQCLLGLNHKRFGGVINGGDNWLMTHGSGVFVMWHGNSIWCRSASNYPWYPCNPVFAGFEALFYCWTTTTEFLGILFVGILSSAQSLTLWSYLLLFWQWFWHPELVWQWFYRTATDIIDEWTT